MYLLASINSSAVQRLIWEFNVVKITLVRRHGIAFRLIFFWIRPVQVLENAANVNEVLWFGVLGWGLSSVFVLCVWPFSKPIT